MSQCEIDQAVAQRMREGRSLYEVDEKLLGTLPPDLIPDAGPVSNLCTIGGEVSQV